MDTKRAMELFDRDMMFRMICQSAVSRAMLDFGQVDPDYANRDAHDIAMMAAVLALQMAFDKDAALTHARAELKAYKEDYERLLTIKPPSFVIEATPPAPSAASSARP